MRQVTNALVRTSPMVLLPCKGVETVVGQVSCWWAPLSLHSHQDASWGSVINAGPYTVPELPGSALTMNVLQGLWVLP